MQTENSGEFSYTQLAVIVENITEDSFFEKFILRVRGRAFSDNPGKTRA